MWIEKVPNEGDTVKIKFADWCNLGTMIGIFLCRFDGKDKIQFGDCIRYLEYGSMLTWQK